MPPCHHLPADQRPVTHNQINSENPAEKTLSPALKGQIKNFMEQQNSRRAYVISEKQLVLLEKFEGYDELDASVVDTGRLPEPEEKESEDEEMDEPTDKKDK